MDTLQDGQNGLPIGIRQRRFLPFHLDRAWMSLLRLHNVGALFLTSKTMASQVKRFLSELKKLDLYGDEFLLEPLDHSESLTFADHRFALGLVIRFCRQLSVVNFGFYFHKLSDSRHTFVRKILQTNTSTLRSLEHSGDTLSSPDAMQLVLACPMLNSLCVDQLDHDTHTRIVACCRAIGTLGISGANIKDHTQISSLLARDWASLTDLTMGSVGLATLQSFATHHIPSLNKFNLSLNCPLTHNAAVAIGRALPGLPNLKSLDIKFDPGSTLGASANETVVWPLAQVSKIYISYGNSAALLYVPQLMAPNLETIAVDACIPVSSARNILASCFAADSLRGLRFKVDEQDRKDSGLDDCLSAFASAIRKGRWPSLAWLDILSSRPLTSEIFRSLLVSPRPASLTRIHLAADNANELTQLLRLHPKPSETILEPARKRPPDAVQIAATDSDSDSEPCQKPLARAISDSHLITTRAANDSLFESLVLSSLEFLHLKGPDVHLSCLDVIFRNCPKLRITSLTGVVIDNPRVSEPGLRPPLFLGIDPLSLRNDPVALGLLMGLPGMEALHLFGAMPDSFLDEFAAQFRSQPTNKTLLRLHLDHVESKGWSSKTIQDIADHFTALELLELPKTLPAACQCDIALYAWQKGRTRVIFGSRY